jgi:hypothetical protein
MKEKEHYKYGMLLVIQRHMAFLSLFAVKE